MIKILVVFGTRPEAIKMAPVIQELQRFPNEFQVKVCVTGQHRAMLDQVLQIFKVKPEIDLNVMTEGQDLVDITSRILIEMRGVLNTEKPDLVLVHGDTTTTFATSLACFYSGSKVGHVEAGLRTNNLHSPFPEEFNRQVVSKLANLHFAPTDLCRSNLLNENIQHDQIFVTGNSVIDALKWVSKNTLSNAETAFEIDTQIQEFLPFNWKSDKYILITGHRRENFGKGFLEICDALAELSENNPEIHFVYPVHLNPNVQKPVREVLGLLNNVHLIPPQDYLVFSRLMEKSYLVLTDSGGIQEEAPSLGKPVLLMRDTTERPEGVEAGTVILVGANKDRIVNGVNTLLHDSARYKEMCQARNPYGDGTASEKIVNGIRSAFENNVK